MLARRYEDATTYDAAGHNGCAAFRLQGAEVSPVPGFWLGMSHFLPGGGADWDATAAAKVYLVLDGQVTVEVEGERAELERWDSVYLAPNERRRLTNESNRPATIVVVIAPPSPLQ